MKKKIAIFNVIILSLFLVFLINIKFNNNTERSKYINKTIEIKDRLLNKVTDGKTLQGKVLIEGEENLEDIELVLYKEDDGEYKKDSVTYTDSEGNYEFNNLDESNYKIEIEENESYRLLNTNILKVTEDLNDINLEAEEKGEFKAEIKKYIKEIKIKSDNEEKTYNYSKESNVIIPLKNVKNLSGTVKYEFEVTNTREEGYVKVIKDKLPEGLSFDSKKNPDWREKNGYLYTSKLSEEKFEAQESKTIELVLDIENTNEGKTYLNKVSITGEVYHTVTFIDGNITYKEEKVIDGDIVTEESLEKEGYKFTGWYSDKKNTKKYNFEDPITEDTTIYAGWQKEIKVTYIINNNSYKEETLYEGNKTSRPTDPQIEGYNFINWYKDNEYKEEYDFNAKLTEDTIIYGKIEKAIVYYTVTYMIEDKEIAKETIQEGTIIENKAGLEKANVEKETRVEEYTFEGWYNEEELKTKYDFTKGIEKDTVVYGKYTSKEVCKTKNNIHIPTKEEIISSINFNIVNITNTTEKDGKVIANNFIVEYNSETDTYSITGYEGNYPSDLVIPDQIKGKDVISVTEVGNNQTFDTVKISSKVKTLSNSFQSATINNKLDFSEAIGLETIASSFKEVSVNDFNLENTINLTSITSMSGIKTDTFSFGNSISLEKLEAGALQNLQANTLDFAKAVNLKSIAGFAYSGVETIDLSNLVSLEKIDSNAFSGDWKNKGSIKKVILNSAIKNIGMAAFEYNEITEIDFECAKPSLESIETLSFAYNDIKDVVLEDFEVLNTFYTGAFGYGSIRKLDLINIPSLVNLDYGAANVYFTDDSEVTLDNIGITEIDEWHIFSIDSNIKSITLKNLENFETLGRFIYSDTVKLEFSNLPKLKTITKDAIKYSKINSDFVLKDLPSLESIESRAIYDTDIAGDIIFENLPNLKIINGDAFYVNMCISHLDIASANNVILKNLPELETIGGAAFEECNITSVTMEELPKLKTIGTDAFFWLNTEKLTIEDLPSLETIGYGAFFDYYDTLKYVTFKNLPNLKSNVLQSLRKNSNNGEYLFEEIHLENLPNVEYISNGTYYTVNNFILKDLDKLNEPDLFKNVGFLLKNTTIENLSSLTSLDGVWYYNYEGITVKDCENLTTLDLTPPYDGAAPLFNLTVENLPSLTTLKRTNTMTENISVKDCENLETVDFTGKYYLKTLTLENLNKLTSISSIQDKTITDISIKNCNSLTLDGFVLTGAPVNTLILENLPSVTKFDTLAFAGAKIQELDLSKLENLTTIETTAFVSNNNLKTLKLPSSLTTIGDHAFASSALTCIEIQGDNTRFNDRWETIGFPDAVTPSTCVFMDEESSNLLSNIFNLNNDSEKDVYNILLYKMDDNSLINDSKTYELERLIGDKFKIINVEKDIENVGNYIISNNIDEEIKSFNNKVYISNIESGTYRLKEVGTENTLTFIIENNKDITGNAKISNATSNINVISSSEAEFTTSIQTGVKRLNYLLIILAILFVLFIIMKKKKKIN